MSAVLKSSSLCRDNPPTFPIIFVTTCAIVSGVSANRTTIIRNKIKQSEMSFSRHKKGKFVPIIVKQVINVAYLVSRSLLSPSDQTKSHLQAMKPQMA
jgi:hypothetical protein